MSTDLKLTLVVKSDGTVVVANSVSKVDQAKKQLDTKMDVVREKFSNVISTIKENVINLVGFDASVDSLLRLTEEVVKTDERLLMAAGSQQAFNQAQKQASQIAKASRADYLSTINLYSGLRTAASQYGISQENVGKATEAVTYGLKLHGASVAEVSSMQNELSQALANGTLAGEGFESILETSPRLMQALADGMGIASGALTQMITDGQLNTQTFIDALSGQSDVLKQEFANMPITIDEAMGQIKNALAQGLSSLVQDLKKFDAAAGITEKIAKGLMLVAENFNNIVKVAAIASVGVGSFYAVQKISLLHGAYKSLIALEMALGGVGKRAAISAVAIKYFKRATQSAAFGVKALTIAIASNPIGFLVTAITVVISALVAFRHQIRPVKGSLATLGDYGTVVFNFLKKAIKSLFNPISSLRKYWNTVTKAILKIAKPAQETFQTIGKYIAEFLKYVKRVINVFIGMWVGAYYATKAAFNDFPRVLSDIVVSAANAALTDINAFVRSTARLLNKLPGVEIDVSAIGFQKLTNHAAGAANNVMNEFQKALSQDYVGNSLNYVEQNLNDLTNKMIDLGKNLTSEAERNAKQRENKEKLNEQELQSLNQIPTTQQSFAGKGNSKPDSLIASEKNSNAQKELDNIQEKINNFLKQQDQTLGDYAFETALIGRQADEVERLRFKRNLLIKQEELMQKLSKDKKDAIEEKNRKKIEEILTQHYIQVGLRAEKKSQKAGEDFAKQQQKTLDDYAFETSLIGKQADEIERLRYEKNLLAQAEQAKQNLTAKGKQMIDEEVQSLIAKRDIQVSTRKQQEELQANDWVGGIKAGLQSLSDNTKTFSQTIEEATKLTFSKMSDGIANFVATGKSSFKDLTVSILQDISKMMIKWALFKAMSSIGQAIGGNFGSALQTIFQAKGGGWNKGVQFYAKGDIFNRPTAFRHAGGLGVMGEAGPEAVMPLTRGANGKLGVQVYGGKQNSQSGGVVNQVQIDVNISNEGTNSDVQTSTQDGKQIAESLKAVVLKTLQNEIRPGGMLATR